jgi:hypothetical protein
MERKMHNDIRAGHKVTVFEWGTNVQFQHNEYVISLAADGQETIVFDRDSNAVFETPGTYADAVVAAVNWINKQI